LSHCLYWASNSLSARLIFFFCSLVSFCGAGGSLGSGAGWTCCAMASGSESKMEKAAAKRVRTTLAIGTPQPHANLEILTPGQALVKRVSAPAREKPRARKRQIPRILRHLSPDGVRLRLSRGGCLAEKPFSRDEPAHSYRRDAGKPGPTASAEAFFPSPRGYRKWPAHGGGTRRCAKVRRA